MHATLDLGFDSGLEELASLYGSRAAAFCSRHAKVLKPLHEEWLETIAAVPAALAGVDTGLMEVPRAMEDATLAPLRELSSSEGVVLGVCGPGAVGKDTLKDALRESELSPSVVVTTTTRAPRRGERDGVDYHFVDEEIFERMRSGDEFVLTQYREGRGHYGTGREAIRAALEDRRVCMIEESPMGLHRIVNDSISEGRAAHLVYVMPPCPPLHHLAARFFCREGDDRLGDAERAVAAIDSTLGRRQIEEFRDAVQLAVTKQPVSFVVNDDVGRMAALVVGALTSR